MKAFFKLFTQGWFLGFLAIACIAVAIWLAGPYLAFADAKPLESTNSRLIAIIVLVVVWTVWVQLRQYRARKAGQQLAQTVVVQARSPTSDPAEAADAQQLRARFEEALAGLRAAKGKSLNLYALPWYVIIGPPGTGKTTIIANSGLHFPLEKKFGREALRGVGGTRNCDWWFTEEAVLLDTAGRYTTQDSDAKSDHAGWLEFLNLLRKHRTRRPINGVLVAMSAPDLLSQSESERRRHIEAVRARLQELSRELKISLPAYVLLTKMDLLGGFTEYFDDLDQHGRAQVWGTTFPLEASRAGRAAEQLGSEFDELTRRLDARLLPRMEAETDVKRRAAIFTFPRQFAALRGNLLEFINDAFERDRTQPALELRGVYFTSGTQQGTPIDRMLGALVRTFGLNMSGAVPATGQPRAYFLQRLLNQVVFKESGLAGVNKRMELRQALVQGLTHAGVLAALLIGIALFTISYQRNRSYLKDVEAAVTQLGQVPAPASASLVSGLDRLDALVETQSVASKYSGDAPLSMRAGLFQGRAMKNLVHDAYVSELNASLVPAVAQHFASRLSGFADDPDRLYEYLKTYLMLGLPERMNTDQLAFLGDLEWQRVFANDPATLERLNRHYQAMLADHDRLRAASLDGALVDRARTSLRQASLPVLMYSRLKFKYAGDTQHAIDVGSQIGLGGDAVFVRKSGKSLSEPIPALYTRAVFDDVSGTGTLGLVQHFVSESWVLGDEIASIAKSPQLAPQLMQLYEDDYIRVWSALLADLTLRPTTNAQDAAQLWGLLAAPTSPLKRLLTVVRSETKLVDPTAKPNLGDKAIKAASSIGSMFSGQKTATAAPPGSKVTKHFESLHKLVDGSPAPIDGTLQKFAAIQGVLAEISALGGPPPLETGSRLSLAIKDLETHAKTLPEPMGGLVARATGKGATLATTTIGNDFTARYRQQVVSECQELAAGRFPLVPSSGIDMPLADFGRIFGPNGTYDGFLKTTMQPFVDANRAVWRWKPEASAIGGASSLPAHFQRANRIMLTYFPAGTPLPEVRFTVTPEFLDAAAARMVLEIDGQTLEYRHGPQRAVPMVWPGPSPGQSAISIEERGGARPNLVEQGPWSLFRLLGKAQLQAQGETRFIASYSLGGRTVRLIIQANSSRNPFARDVLQGFNCQG